MARLQGNREGVILAATALLRGDLVALPTETVYGLAADALNEDAVLKIFSVKGRPLVDPLIVHVLDQNWVEKIAYWNDVARCLTEAFWPGPLTVILRKKSCVSDKVTAGKNTVALRSPAQALFREVLEATELPLAAPSANPFGYVSPTLAEHVERTLGADVTYILDGGPCEHGVESTIIDTTSDLPKMLRPGPITCEQIFERTGLHVAPYVHVEASGAAVLAPGMLSQHYSPHTPLTLVDTMPEVADTCARVFIARPKKVRKNDYWLSENGDLNDVARTLFALLQRLDQENFQQIYIEKVQAVGIGVAINDRLRRAAAKRA